MMLQYDYDEPVEQILFGPTPKGGLGVRQRSVGLSDQSVDRWAERLGKYNRLTPIYIEQRPWAPPRAFSYFEFQDGSAALLTRFNNGESGRNSSHALIGSVRSLGYYAMFLSEWDGWRAEDSGATLPSLNRQAWQHCVGRATDAVRVGVRERLPALTALVRAVLLGEADYFTVLVDTDPLPLLTLARDILDPVLSFSGNKFGWTYSTYEASDTDPEASPHEDGAPRFWCVRSLPASGQTYRHRIWLDQGVEDDPYGELASELITQYFNAQNMFPTLLTEKLFGINDRGSRVAHLLKENQLVRTPSRPKSTVPDLVDAAAKPQPAPQPHEIPPSGPPARWPAQPKQQDQRRPRERRFVTPPDANELFKKLDGREELTREQRHFLIMELRSLWNLENPYEVSVRRTMDRVERQLVTFQRVLMITALALLLVGILAFFTARREISVPQPTVITVTVPQPAPQTPSTQPPTDPPGRR